nr:MAG TPA: Cas system-associated protein [Caudoviricetes sp.]
MAATIKRLSREDIRLFRDNLDRRNFFLHGGASYEKPLSKSVIARRTERQVAMRFKHRSEDDI